MPRNLNLYAVFVVNAGLVLALLSAAAAVSAGLGTRYEIWNFRIGLAILKWSAYGGLVSAVISSAGGVAASRSGSRIATAFIGLILGVSVVAVPAYWLKKARAVPPIHDITTDVTDPPAFSALLPLRKNASNPPDYGGAQIASQQLRAYPDIKPLLVEVPPEAAYEMALAASRRMGWHIVDAGRADGRIEAFDKTFWFGFTDDIVIRIRKDGQGSRIDIRSASRVGISDLGINADRIRSFFREIGKNKANIF